jgi:uncharacterized protein YecE (DUF72 family)
MLFAGTSGWAYAGWKPNFYPAKTPSKKFLEFYATRLNSVEVNYTFRRFPSEKLLSGWIAATSPGFRFSVKANQLITHIKRLRDAREVTQRFLSSLQLLVEAGKLGAVLYQLPPFLKADPALLSDFLALLPAAVRSTFEFRHDSWFTEEVFTLLRQANAALCLAESEKLVVPDVATAGYVYYRLRKPEYSAAERKQLAERIGAQLAQQRDAFVYFKHEETPEGALYAEELMTLMTPAAG